jgi:UDP-GlcNAc:undecaprenyl-phosphate GlcNAc-1-phosphate transferase
VLFDVAFTLIRRLLAGENIARAHRGHLYQIAARSGVAAWLVALIHWGFAVIGGLSAIGFLCATSNWKLPVLLVPVAVQFLWTGIVISLARRTKLTNWS